MSTTRTFSGAVGVARWGAIGFGIALVLVGAANFLVETFRFRGVGPEGLREDSPFIMLFGMGLLVGVIPLRGRIVGVVQAVVLVAVGIGVGCVRFEDPDYQPMLRWVIAAMAGLGLALQVLRVRRARMGPTAMVGALVVLPVLMSALDVSIGVAFARLPWVVPMRWATAVIAPPVDGQALAVPIAKGSGISVVIRGDGLGLVDPASAVVRKLPFHGGAVDSRYGMLWYAQGPRTLAVADQKAIAVYDVVASDQVNPLRLRMLVDPDPLGANPSDWNWPWGSITLLDDSTLAWSDHADLIVQDVMTNRRLAKLGLMGGAHSDPILSGDGKLMAIWSGSYLELFDRASLSCIRQLRGTDYFGTSGTMFSADGKYLIQVELNSGRTYLFPLHSSAIVPGVILVMIVLLVWWVAAPRA